MKNKRVIKQVPFFDHCFDKTRLKKWISQLYYETICTEDLTILNFVEALKTIGFQEATRAGVSIGIDDLKIPPKKAILLRDIEYEVEKTTHSFALNRLTALENFQSFIDIWHRTSELIKVEVVSNFEQTDTLNPVYMMAFSGARGNLSQVSQLVGMRGFMSDPEGQIIDYPIRSNFREGLTLTEYVISCYGARKGLVDTALRTADAGYLTRRLVDVAHSIIITRFDCKTTQGIWLSAIKENNQIVYPLQKRLMGRVLAEDIYFPYIEPETKTNQITQWSYFHKNQQIDAVNAKLLATCFTRVLVRSPLRCLKKKRLCQLCYGWTLPHAYLAPIGEAVGILAAQSIGEPGTQLTMRTFHTGGVFSGALSEELKAPYSGKIHYKKPIQGALFRSSNGQLAFRTTQPGFLVLEPLEDSSSNEKFELNFPPTSILFRKNNEKILKGDVLIELPKDQEVGKETILNTYTYYSKRSGILKVYKTNLYPFENYDLVSHPKLPKIEPFYQKAQSINRTFHSFKIYSGQILKTYQINEVLAKPGDLVNTKSLINLTKLHFPAKTHFASLKPTIQNSTQHNLIANVITKTNVLDLSLTNLKYSKHLGYVSCLNGLTLQKQSQVIIPSVNSNIISTKTGFGITINPLDSNSGGKLIYPLIFSKFNKIQSKTNWEKQFYFDQINRPLKPRIVFKQLIHLIRLSPKTDYLNQMSFYIPEPKYQLFDTQSQNKKQSKNYRTQIVNGSVITKKSKHSKILNVDVLKSNWVSRNDLLAVKMNLQQNVKTAKAKRDGFIIPKSLKRQNLVNRHKKMDSNIYWEVQNRYTFKTGWPIYSTSKKCNYKLQNQLHFFGQTVLADIHFLTNCKYTEYVHQNSPNKALKQLVSKSIVLQRTSTLFAQKSLIQPILLIRSIQESSFTNVNTNTNVKLAKKVFYKDKKFDEFKKIQKLWIQTNHQIDTFSVGKLNHRRCNELFLELNKFVCTNNKARILDQQRSNLQIQSFFKKILSLEGLENVKVSSTKLYEKCYYKNPILTHLNFKLTENTLFKNQGQFFDGKEIFDRKYSYGFIKTINQENYFKTKSNAIYLPNLSEKQLNPYLESHLFCPYNGELGLNVRNNGDEISSLILTSNDTYTIPMNALNRKVEIGEYIYLGLPITTNETIPYTGQVIQIRKNQIKIQLIENSLVASNSRFFCKNNQFIEKTSQIFTQSYPRLQMGDIVQGIPKIEEFFEARQTKDGNPFDNNLHNRLSRRFKFYRKNCGYPLFIAARKSIYDIQNLIIDSIFKLYSSQGIDISDKHLEIIVRQMTSKVKVTQFWKYGTPFVPFKHPLPTELYSRHYIERYQYRKKNTRIYNVRYEPAILGITRAALENDGFISAASFQETTRILSRGAIFQKKDYLKGLKENVILGHIIPAGTAVRTYSRRFQPSLMEQILAKQTLQILTINHEWKLGMVDSNTVSSQYLNPIRHNILQCICLEYLRFI